MLIVTKVIVVVGVIIVGVFNVHFEPQDFVAPCGDSVVKANLHHEKDEDDDHGGEDDPDVDAAKDVESESDTL